MLCVNINIPFKTIHRIPSTSGFEIQHILASLQDRKQRIENANKHNIGKIIMSVPFTSRKLYTYFLQTVHTNVLYSSFKFMHDILSVTPNNHHS